MPVQIDARALNQVIRTAAVVNTESECQVTVGTDEICLRSCREDRSIYVEHSLPSSELFTSHGDETGSFWIRLDFIKQYLRRTANGEVVVTFPFEMSDSSMVLDSDGLTYRGASIIDQYGHYLPDLLVSVPESSCTLRHGALEQAVKAVNLIDKNMQVQINPETQHIQFSAEGIDGSDCTYVVHPSDIEEIHGSTVNLPIPIETLKEITPKIPNSNFATLYFFRNHLQYTVEYPSSDATLRLYIAEQSSTVPK